MCVNAHLHNVAGQRGQQLLGSRREQQGVVEARRCAGLLPEKGPILDDYGRQCALIVLIVLIMPWLLVVWAKARA